MPGASLHEKFRPGPEVQGLGEGRVKLRRGTA